MSMRYVRDDVNRRVRATVWDPLVWSEMLAISEHQVAEGTWRYGLLLDLRDVTQPGGADCIRNLTAHVQTLVTKNGPRGPVAAVANRSATFGMARMFAILAEDAALDVGVFRDIPAAEKWLTAFEERPTTSS